jgi:hypothetical protein
MLVKHQHYEKELHQGYVGATLLKFVFGLNASLIKILAECFGVN